MKNKLSILLRMSLLFLCLNAMTSERADAIDCTPFEFNDTAGRVQLGTSWCWVACVQWLTQEFNEPWYSQQQLLNYWLCVWEVNSPWCDLCAPPNWVCPDDYSPSLNKVIDGMEWEALDFFLTPLRGPPADTTDEWAQWMHDYICVLNCHMYVTFVNPADLAHGHAVIAYGIDETPATGGLYTTLSAVYYMDPDTGIKDHMTFENFVNPGPSSAPGPWYATFGASDMNPSWVAISDISAFWYDSQNYSGLYLKYKIAATADPGDSAAVYVSDNPMGPARLIRNSVQIPVINDPETPADEINAWLDSYRAPYEDEYYYYLNHGPGLFPEVMEPSDLFANGDNPVLWNGGGLWSDPRPTLDPPTGADGFDPGLNVGREMMVQWDLSEQDSIVHCYNIYRRDSCDGYVSSFEYLASVPPGISSFVDTMVATPLFYSYMVSAAHCGPWDGDGNGNFGIFNDFSAPSTPAKPVNDFFIRTLEIVSEDTLTSCPNGDLDTLIVRLTITNSNGLPTIGVPADSMFLFVLPDSGVLFCDGDTIATGSETDQSGATEFVYSAIGGCGAVKITGEVMGLGVTGTLTVVVRSPDYNGDGIINVQDLSALGMAFPPNCSCGDPTYDTCVDYNLDCVINIVDLSIFADHYNHSCLE